MGKRGLLGSEQLHVFIGSPRIINLPILIVFPYNFHIYNGFVKNDSQLLLRSSSCLYYLFNLAVLFVKQAAAGGSGFRQTESYTCNGTSLGDTCLDNLLNSLRFERDKIRTFTNQKKRAESFKKLIGNKGGKDDQFGNTTTYLLIALGGNMTNLNCSGKTSLTEEAAETYT